MPPKRDSGAGAGEEAKTGRWGVKIENDGQAEPELPGKPAEVLLHALLFRTIALALQHGTWHGVAWKSHQGTLARCSAGLLHWRVRAITSVAVCITAYLCTCVDMCVHARHIYCTHILYVCGALAAPLHHAHLVPLCVLFWIDRCFGLINRFPFSRRVRKSEDERRRLPSTMQSVAWRSAQMRPRVLRGVCSCVRAHVCSEVRVRVFVCVRVCVCARA